MSVLLAGPAVPGSPGLALTDEKKVMLVGLGPGKEHCSLLPISFQIRELQPSARSPQHREALCTPGFPCVALDSVQMGSLLGKTLVSRSTSACRESVPSSALPWLCSPASSPVLGTQVGDPKVYVSTKPLAGTGRWSLFLPPGEAPGDHSGEPRCSCTAACLQGCDHMVGCHNSKHGDLNSMPRTREKSQAWSHWGGRDGQILEARWLVSPANLVTPRPVRGTFSKAKCLVLPRGMTLWVTFWSSFTHPKEVYSLKGTHVGEAGSSWGVDMEVSPGHF